MSATSPTLVLPSAVTLHEISAVLRQVEAALAAGGTGPLALDASGVRELDSSAVALLLQAQRLATGKKRDLKLSGLPDKLLALARLYGVESLLVSASADAE